MLELPHFTPCSWNVQHRNEIADGAQRVAEHGLHQGVLYFQNSTRNVILLTCLSKAQPFPCRLSRHSQMPNSLVSRSLTTNWAVNANSTDRNRVRPLSKVRLSLKRFSRILQLNGTTWGNCTPNFTKNDKKLKKLRVLIHLHPEIQYECT
jgi:hypothetical protein